MTEDTSVDGFETPGDADRALSRARSMGEGIPIDPAYKRSSPPEWTTLGDLFLWSRRRTAKENYYRYAITPTQILLADIKWAWWCITDWLSRHFLN